jgi:MFS family permease
LQSKTGPRPALGLTLGAASAGALGAMLGTVYATNIAGYTILGGDGWRFAFRTVAVIAGIIGWVTLTFASDPNHMPQANALAKEMKHESLSETLTEFATVRNA